jgi:hypothetical protein
MAKVRFLHEISDNASELNIKGVETIEVERPPIPKFDRVDPPLQAKLIHKIDGVDSEDIPEDVQLLSVIRNDEACFAGGYAREHKLPISYEWDRSVIEELEEYFIIRNIEALVRKETVDKAIAKVRQSISNLDMIISLSDKVKEKQTHRILNLLDVLEHISDYISMRDSGRIKEYREHISGLNKTDFPEWWYKDK